MDGVTGGTELDVGTMLTGAWNTRSEIADIKDITPLRCKVSVNCHAGS
jgi:hypothetical protein